MKKMFVNSAGKVDHTVVPFACLFFADDFALQVEFSTQ